MDRIYTFFLTVIDWVNHALSMEENLDPIFFWHGWILPDGLTPDDP